MKRSFFSLNKKRKKMFLKKKGGWICFVNAPQTHKLRAFLPYFCSLRLKLSKVAMAFSSTKSQDNQINSTIIYSPLRIKTNVTQSALRKPLKGQSPRREWRGNKRGEEFFLCVDCGSAAEVLEPPAGPSQGWSVHLATRSSGGPNIMRLWGRQAAVQCSSTKVESRRADVQRTTFFKSRAKTLTQCTCVCVWPQNWK